MGDDGHLPGHSFGRKVAGVLGLVWAKWSPHGAIIASCCMPRYGGRMKSRP